MQGRYEVVGVIYIDTAITPQKALAGKGANQFTEEHLRLMIAIAHQAALAVEDTSYYKALVQAERLAAVGQTIASLSHHIKNILQGVRGGSYLIELGLGDHDAATKGEEPDEEAERKAVDTIRKGWSIVERNQERISALVLDMLTFSKEREPEPQPSNLNEVASEVIDLMASRAEEQSVQLVWQPARDMPTLMFDPEALHRAILNVVTNAIDACDEKEDGRVTVTAEYDDVAKVARVMVEDNGAGIPPDDVEAIFTVFVSRKGGRGTGLGLPVTRKILEEHGGQVRLESTVGKGSRFTLELPATPSPAEGDQPARVTQAFLPGDLPSGAPAS
jgi:signal transduction histidine kinase